MYGCSRPANSPSLRPIIGVSDTGKCSISEIPRPFGFEDLNIWISDLFRLPACSPALRDEGKDFDIRISNVSVSQDPFGSAMPG